MSMRHYGSLVSNGFSGNAGPEGEEREPDNVDPREEGYFLLQHTEQWVTMGAAA